MSADTVEKLALMVAELMQSMRKYDEQIAMLRREVLDVKDIARSCPCFQADDFK